MQRRAMCGFGTVFVLFVGGELIAQRVPHGQDRVPGPARSPEAALASMVVPEGFSVDLVLHEPALVNPVAMTFAPDGRLWVTESLEYPRSSAGPGRDRVKVFADRDGDGRFEESTVFAEGLNIPSGIAVGHGGVWLAASPDLLFLADDDGDGRADRREVVVTGFGRADTHELPNSLTWGPDGWLYGLNGVFNHCHVVQDGREYRFSAAVFRVHPRTRRFELFAEGTSNPWGIAFDEEGSLFVSACVIDHLWCLVETGFYQRQSGASPRFVWELGSIVEHRHQKAAYCGLTWLESERFPASMQRRLVMGNIHGGCLNVDVAERRGAGYFARPEEDLLSTDDAWFMPVAQKLGPDGALYVLDWYDRYHCYQDARRDPEGIDRERGRLYRVRWNEAPARPAADLGARSPEDWFALLDAPDTHRRRAARRLLAESEALADELHAAVVDRARSPRQRHNALWALLGRGELGTELLLALLEDEDRVLRAWGWRSIGARSELDAPLRAALFDRAADPEASVALQRAIAASKHAVDAVALWLRLWRAHGDDEVLAKVVWNLLQARLPDDPAAFVASLDGELGDWPRADELLRRSVDRLLAGDEDCVSQAGALVARCLADGPEDLRRAALRAALRPLRDGELDAARRDTLQDALADELAAWLAVSTSASVFDGARLAAAWGDPRARAALHRTLASNEVEPEHKLEALDVLVGLDDPDLREAATRLLASLAAAGRSEHCGALIARLGQRSEPWVAEVLTAAMPALPEGAGDRAVDVLLQRIDWSRRLLGALEDGVIPRAALRPGHVRRLHQHGDEVLSAQVERAWGSLREYSEPERERWIAEVRRRLRAGEGDPFAGRKVFTEVCAACHRIYGQGNEVGPELTDNGRGTLEQLLSNVLDPNLVVGADDRGWTLWTLDGRVLEGLLIEDSEQRVVLHVEGGEKEVVPRREIDELRPGELSLMPARLEEQIGEEEMLDLFAFLVLDRPPEDPGAKPIAGAREVAGKETRDPREFAALVGEVAPGWWTEASGDDGVALLPSFGERAVVLRVHPLSREEPCALRGRFKLGEAPKLRLTAGHHPQGDWRLVVRVEDEVLLDVAVSSETARAGWVDHVVDLERWAGRSVELAIENHATEWRYEYGYFDSVEISEGGRAP